jgi:hypothetical protein
MAKAKKEKKAKKGETQVQNEWPHVSVSEHPRARAAIRRWKAWGGLVGFGLVAFLSYRAGVDTFGIGIRALLAGIGLYLAVWVFSVWLWRHIVLHEAKTEAERRRDERQAQLDELLERQRAAAEADNDDGTAAA